jgi:hypothetical protein
MNIAKFQFILNHDDPDVVQKGLDEFQKKILVDNQLNESFGYYGFSTCKTRNSRKAITGLLETYLQNSPQIEELFVLWNLPGRDENRTLSTSHILCISTILHCASSNEYFCNLVVSRILYEYSKSIHMQLGSGDTDLVHSTLGLLIVMASSSKQNCRDTYQKLQLSNATFSTLIQKGKSKTWTAINSDNVQITIQTDTRQLIIALLLIVIEQADFTISNEIFAPLSLFKKILHSVHKDLTETLDFLFNSLINIFSNQSTGVINSFLHHIFDTVFIQKLILLFNSTNEIVCASVSTFLTNFSQHLSALLKNNKKNNQQEFSSINMTAHQLVKFLSSDKLFRHTNVTFYFILAIIIYFYYFLF